MHAFVGELNESGADMIVPSHSGESVGGATEAVVQNVVEGCVVGNQVEKRLDAGAEEVVTTGLPIKGAAVELKVEFGESLENGLGIEQSLAEVERIVRGTHSK